MHGLSPDEEIDYWRKRAEMLERSIANAKQETAKDVARIAELNEQANAIEAALNAANVATRTEPTWTHDDFASRACPKCDAQPWQDCRAWIAPLTTGDHGPEWHEERRPQKSPRVLTPAERVQLLVRDRDEARRLAADAAHQLANERQVVVDLRETNQQLCEQVGHLNAGCVKYERVVEAARATSFTLRNIAFATKNFAPHELSFGGERVTDYASRVAAKLVDALDAEDGQ